MCFSPTASFSAGLVLSATGTASMRESRNGPQRVLSGLPLVFAMQQVCEGILWLSLQNEAWARWQMPATYAFLFFAQVLWPVYIPYTILLFEKDVWRRRVISVLTLCGLALAIYRHLPLQVSGLSRYRQPSYPVHSRLCTPR